MGLTDVLRWGPLALPWWFLGLAAGLVVLTFALKGLLKDAASRWTDRLWTVLAGALLIWKLSPLLDSWDRIMANPLALVYLPGTGPGLVLGIGFAAVWLVRGLFREPTGDRARLVVRLTLALGLAAVPTGILAAGLAAFPGPAAATNLEGPVLRAREGAPQVVGWAPGRVLIVNFWATWCPPCRAEIPEYRRFWAAADPTKVAVPAVDLVTTEPDSGIVETFIREQGMTFPILFDDEGEAARTYGIESIPTTLVFDPHGQLVERIVGAVTRERLEALVKKHSR